MPVYLPERVVLAWIFLRYHQEWGVWALRSMRRRPIGVTLAPTHRRRRKSSTYVPLLGPQRTHESRAAEISRTATRLVASVAMWVALMVAVLYCARCSGVM
jgi:hypothetical protein